MRTGGFKCPNCGAWTNVLRSEDQNRRRRECANLHRFWTRELSEDDLIGLLPSLSKTTAGMSTRAKQEALAKIPTINKMTPSFKSKEKP